MLIRIGDNNCCVESLIRVGGIADANAIIAVIGTGMDRFPIDAHISSWSGLYPQNNESTKKRYSRNDLLFCNMIL